MTDTRPSQSICRTRSRVAVGLWAGLLLGFASCQAPGGASSFNYGSAPLVCVEAADSGPVPLMDGLGPLRAAFDESVDAPRVIALMPHMGCERGAEILRREVLDAHPGKSIALFVIWQDEARTGGAAAAARASRYLQDSRVSSFYDCRGIAGRAFARGNLPVAEAREVFLFYPAGLTWPGGEASPKSVRPQSARPVAAERPPKTDSWVHQLGRVAPERFCTPEELPRAIRNTVEKLLQDAEARRRAADEAAPV